ncbi:TRAP transporter large permease [Lacrimispora sp. 210928-DFI.3.58]|uniref:TRAP transporter large permease n=1 Tax=Lacrimispora sp. 210928-DFI.3.58 TaxID=2883214 RepID=UPI0015B6FACA|nr:TRAP transporter large permease [Lacrimispora sp. 210928-DFI.3.58]MCB7321009.1 TRAP transporter large permease [Lacrimispora sp. 210928-DFI.3.58]
MSTTVIATLMLVGIFLALVFLRVPIVYAIGIASLVDFFYLGINPMQMALKFVSNLNSYTLLAVPFFILMGELMSAGGITDTLIDFSRELVGWFRGGAAMVNVVASFFFGGISGSSSADCASLGPIEIKMMEEQGYDRDFSTCLTMASSVEGILVPPSQNMVIYTLAAAGVTSVSIGQLFLAGYVPGAVLSVTLMIYSYYISVKKNYPVTGRFDLKACIRAFFRAIWGMLSVLIVVVGVIAGVFTTTESAACAVVWSLVVGLFIYKGFGVKDIPGIFHNVTMTLGKVLILLGVSGAFTYLLTYLKVPETVSTALFSITDNKILILIMLNILMLFLGCMIEMACLILMLTPVILPIWMSLGLSPIHLGVVMVLNLGIGLLTPPVGSTLFIGSAISGIPIEKLSKSMIPFYIVMGVALLILTYFPQTFMWLPNMAY